MISLNLVSLWINCCFVERLIMLSVSVFIHFLFIVNMYWQVPYSGSTVPVFSTYNTFLITNRFCFRKFQILIIQIHVSVIFFRDSLIITASLLISTVFIKHLYLSAKPIPAVLGSTVTVLTGNSLGKWFFNLEPTADPEDETMEENRPNEESPNETTRDTAILVGEQPPESVEKPSKLDDKTRVFAKVLDRLLFIVGFVSYTLMIITLIPRN